MKTSLNIPLTSLPEALAAGLRVERMTGAMGARIYGVDLRQPLNEAQLNVIQRAFDEHLLLTFPGQEAISYEEHMVFSENFGPHQDLPHIPLVDGYP